MDRRPISKRLRFEVFKRDGFACIYCGATPVQCALTIDHVEAHSRGGSDDAHNLVTACGNCNAGKSDVPLGQKKLGVGKVTDADRDHADQILEFLAIQRQVGKAKREVVGDALALWVQIFGEPSQAFESSLAVVVGEFGLADTMDAINITARKGLSSETNNYRYFHGVVRRWRKEAQAKRSARLFVAPSAADVASLEAAIFSEHDGKSPRHAGVLLVRGSMAVRLLCSDSVIGALRFLSYGMEGSPELIGYLPGSGAVADWLRRQVSCDARPTPDWYEASTQVCGLGAWTLDRFQRWSALAYNCESPAPWVQETNAADVLYAIKEQHDYETGYALHERRTVGRREMRSLVVTAFVQAVGDYACPTPVIGDLLQAISTLHVAEFGDFRLTETDHSPQVGAFAYFVVRVGASGQEGV